MWEPRAINHVERNQSMAEITSPGPMAGIRLIDFATVVMASSAARTAEVLAELATATPKARKTA